MKVKTRAGEDDRAGVPKLQPAARLMLRESVYESIKGMLMDASLEPGSRVSIDGLARDLEVSPTPVREALFRCEAEGLVVRRPNVGYTVAPILDRQELLDLYDLRLQLEPIAAERAAARASAADLAELKDAERSMRSAVGGDGYEAYREFAGQDAKLHHRIAVAAGNALVADTLGRLRAHTHSYRLYFRRGIAEVTVAEHREILAAVLDHDEAGAATAMRLHLEASRARLLSGVG